MSDGSLIWRVGGASVRGSSHVRRGMENEDAFKFLCPDGVGGSVIASVSDGHGAQLHSRSAIGSAFAVDAAAQILGWNVDSLDDGELDDTLAQDVTEYWRKLVNDHVGETPLEPDRLEAVKGDAVLAYGATLIAARLTRDIGQFIQIGDGDLLLGYPDGRLERPLQADQGLHGEETYSLCLGDAAQHFRTATLWRDEDANWPDFMFLSTDGISKSFSDESKFRDAIAQLKTIAGTGWDALMESLPEWLSELSSLGSGDDSTACIATRVSDNKSPSLEGGES